MTTDDIAELLAAAPPRHVPAHVRRTVSGGFLGWGGLLFGLIFGGVGLIFTYVFFPWRLWDDWRLAADHAQTTAGVVQNVSETHMSINETQVIEYVFSYNPDTEGLREGRCYTTGQRWGKNANVTVRYLRNQPELACIEGARLSNAGWFGAFVILFPLIGGGLVIWFLGTRQRQQWLLSYGQLAEAEVVSVDETTMSVNYQSVYRIIIRSPALANGEPLTIKRVNKPDVNLALKRARDNQPVFVLYDPYRPKRLLFPEALIGR